MRMKLSLSILYFLSCLLSTQGEEILSLKSERQLFVDEYLLERTQDLSLRLHHPVEQNVALEFDKPWEGRYCAYITVIQDEDVYRMYYRGSPKAGKDGNYNEVTCYAESEDGIHWHRPNVGIYEYEESEENNIILKDLPPFSHNFCPFLDTNPEASSSARYKALAGTKESGLVAFISTDGIHWKKMREEPVITEGAFDSQNVSFWSESEEQYVCYFRTWSQGEFQGYRTISRATSKDFIHWSEPVEMSYGDTPREHLYTNQTRPYFRAPQIYLSLAARFMPGRQVLTAERFQALGGEKAYAGDCSDTVLMSTRGGEGYNRTFMEGFIRPGLGLSNWSSRSNYTACGVVPTGEGEISMYVQRRYGQRGHYLRRLSLRTDGFVSLHGDYESGEAVTYPFTFRGDQLLINYSTSAAGSIWVEILDQAGDPIPGFTQEDCVEIIGDEVERKVLWKESSDLSALQDQAIRLRFVLKDADCYSFQFREAGE